MECAADAVLCSSLFVLLVQHHCQSAMSTFNAIECVRAVCLYEPHFTLRTPRHSLRVKTSHLRCD
jgi:hypothetical protein